MKKEKQEGKRRFLSSPGRLKWSLLVAGFIVFIGLLGYTVILLGGKLIVDNEQLILDATTTLETPEGEVIGELYNENRTPIPLEDIPEHVKDAFIAIEDRRFYSHGGVDFKSVIRAVYKDILARSMVEGASTLTQQLAKNLFLDNEKTWTRKTKEVMAAVYLERKLTKNEILELYINQMYYGQGIYGIERASQRFFSKSASELSVTEGAMLAGLAKAPNGYSPTEHPEKALKRRNVVLQAMENAGYIDTEQRLEKQGKTLGLTVQQREVKPWADSYIDLVMKEAADSHQLSIDELKRGGYRIIVNIDEMIQQIAYDEFQNDDYFPGNKAGIEGAFVMMDQKNGKILTAIGARDYHLGDLNRVTVKRQPGSTMKPIAVYGPAMMDDYGPYSMLRDELLEYDGYTPANIDGEYAGAVTVYESLKQSKNASTVWLLDQIGINYAKDYLKKMHLDIPDEEGLALALGGLSKGLSPLDMIVSYRTFAHQGKVTPAYTIDKIFDRDNELIAEANPIQEDVFSPQVAWNMTEMLIAAVQSGTGSAGEYGKALAGKTGSTGHQYVEKANKDIWFVGYTPEYVSALWMGYDREDKEHYLTGGSSYPTRLTKRILTEVDRHKDLATAFAKPDDVEEVPAPIHLPKITNVRAAYTFAGFSMPKGKITWSGSEDERTVYRIYKEQPGINERVGEVTGQTEFEIEDVSLMNSESYYIVPYDPLTKVEGERSEAVKLSF